MRNGVRRGWWLVVGLAALSWGVAPLGAEAPAEKARGVQPREVVLDNGLRLLLVERREEPTVAAGVFFDVGSVNDPRGQSGIAHLFEHMLFKGTKVVGTKDYEAEKALMEQQEKLWDKMNEEMNRMRLMKRLGTISDVLDPNEWTEEYKSLKKQYDELLVAQREYIINNEFFNLYTSNGGAGLNAGTGSDITMYFVQLPSNKLELFFWLESDRMVNGVMREFYVERDNVREERRLRTESTPTGKYDEAFEAMFWQAHPYGIPVLGWASEVESITVDDVREFYRLFYAPNNARVVLVGDFDSEQAIEMARRYFGRIPRGPHPPRPVITEEPPPIAERRFYAEAETNPRLRIRYHSVALGHTDEAALDVLGGLLSGKSGRLYRRLVTQEDAAIGEPSAGNQGRKYAGYFGVTVTIKDTHTPEAVEAMVLEEIEKLRDGEITTYELERVKNQVLSSSVRRLKNNFGLMFQLGALDTWLDWSHINESTERMLAVTADDVRRVVKSYLDPKTRTVAIYRTRPVPEGESAEPEDPELAAVLAQVPPEAQPQVRAMIEQIRSSQDLDRINDHAQRLEQVLASGQVPAEQRPVLEYMVKTLKGRAKLLEAAAPEENN